MAKPWELCQYFTTMNVSTQVCDTLKLSVRACSPVWGPVAITGSHIKLDFFIQRPSWNGRDGIKGEIQSIYTLTKRDGSILVNIWIVNSLFLRGVLSYLCFPIPSLLQIKACEKLKSVMEHLKKYMYVLLLSELNVQIFFHNYLGGKKEA